MEQYNSCGVLMKQIHDALEKNANNTLRKLDLTFSQIEVLLILQNFAEKQLSLKQLEKQLHLAQSTTAGIVTRLEKKGFVIRFSDASDKRIKYVRITPLGEQCCREAEKQKKKAEQQLLSGLTQTEQEIFYVLLKKVKDVLK
ncbi:MAG: MarR family transcriptional regulator [Firmicutes bacterium]|nr:MarR family transcriptional regulator [Bacillota bacterium]